MQNLDVAEHKQTGSSAQYREPAPQWHRDNKMDLFALANAAGKLVGSGEARPQALDDFFGKLRRLEHEWVESEKRYQDLKTDNERLTNQLVHTKAKCAIYQKKLKFILDNQKNFAKLKEMYLLMKARGENCVRPFDVSDRASQTAPLNVCVSSYSIGAGNFPTGSLMPIHQDSLVSIRKSELDEAQQNLKTLKDMIMRREQSWNLGKQIESGLRSEIKALQTQKDTLEEILTIKDSEIETLKSIQIKPTVKEEMHHEMKRIIAKMDRRMRDLERAGRIGRYIVIFNDKEREVLQSVVESQRRDPTKKGTATAKRAQMNKSCSMTTAKTGKVQPTLSSISERKTDKWKRNYSDESKEIEALQKIRKDIVAKQNALREKVQEIIDYSMPSISPFFPTPN